MNTRPFDGAQLTHPNTDKYLRGNVVTMKHPELCTVEWSEILFTLRRAGLTHRPAEAKGAATPLSGDRVPATRWAYGPPMTDRAGLIPQPRHSFIGGSSFAPGRVILGSPALESFRSHRTYPSMVTTRCRSKAIQGAGPLIKTGMTTCQQS